MPAGSIMAVFAQLSSSAGIVGEGGGRGKRCPNERCTSCRVNTMADYIADDQHGGILFSPPSSRQVEVAANDFGGQEGPRRDPIRGVEATRTGSERHDGSRAQDLFLSSYSAASRRSPSTATSSSRTAASSRRRVISASRHVLSIVGLVGLALLWSTISRRSCRSSRSFPSGSSLILVDASDQVVFSGVTKSAYSAGSHLLSTTATPFCLLTNRLFAALRDGRTPAFINSHALLDNRSTRQHADPSRSSFLTFFGPHRRFF